MLTGSELLVRIPFKIVSPRGKFEDVSRCMDHPTHLQINSLIGGQNKRLRHDKSCEGLFGRDIGWSREQGP